MYVHVQRLMQCIQELFLHLLVKITSVTQGVDIVSGPKYTLMTLSGMAVAVAHEAPAVASTLHHGSASNFPSLPLMTLNSGCAVMNLHLKML